MEILENETEDLLYLTVQEAAETLLMSQSSVYAWVDRGRLEAEELPSGKIIVISKKEVEKIRKLNTKSRRNRVSKQMQQLGEKQLEQTGIDNNLQDDSNNFQHRGETIVSTVVPDNYNNLQDSLELARLISELSSKAGKYELLSDLQKENKENAEYWKNEYFRLQSENNEIKAENIVLKKQLESTRKGFFGFLRK